MGKSLFIAEKPSVAREFARVLQLNTSNKDGYMESENAIITWCVGHLVTMSYPEAYDEKYKRWSLDTIPFIPETFKYEVIENVKKQSRFHPRCGTSFIFVVLIISIFISSVLVVLFPTIDDIRPLWIAIKLLIVPLTVALSYEFIKYAGCHDNVFVKILSFPGLMMQRISTKDV